ncbi:MAG: glycosyltransferase [Bacteroidota bacterium]|nr:glycosyltransferase [Bacteroidota bacterium]
MKKVLIVTYYFPPSGGPGVQRVLKFAKYLPQFGWEPVILTVENGDYPARDESLLNEIPSSLKIYRTKIFEPYSLYRALTGKQSGVAVDVNNIPKKGERKKISEAIAESIRSTLFIPDARIGWLATAVKEGKKIIEREDVRMMYSSSPPYTCALIARALHRAKKIPWVAGFRDPWTGFLSAPKRWFLPAAIDKHLERSCFKEASRIEVAWNGICTDIRRKYPDIPSEKIEYLPNGFDSADFPSAGRPRNDKFTVTYTGSMYGVRNPKTFFEAVITLVNAGKVDVKKIRLRFIGRFGAEVLAMFRQPIISECVEVVSYLPHAESIRALVASDALLLVVDEFEGHNDIVPGKVFEYLGASRPIIAVAPEGAASALLRETGSGKSALHHDIAAIENIFLEYYNDYLYTNNSLQSEESARTYQPNTEVISHYERKEVTKRLADIFNELVPF